MFDRESLLPRYRAFRKLAVRIDSWTIWLALLCFAVFVIGLCFEEQLSRLSGLSADGVPETSIAAGVLLVLVSPLHRILKHRLARKWGLLCPQCGRPLSQTTILYALDLGQCWHCSPPVAAVAIDNPSLLEGALPPKIETSNPYQPPQVADGLQVADDAELAAHASLAQAPVAAVNEVTLSLAMLLGPLAGVIIHNCLLGPDEAWWRQNRLPAEAYKTSAAEAEHRRAILRSKRILGWYLLGWMTMVPGLAIWGASRLPAELPTWFHAGIYYGLVFVLASGLAFWTANRLPLSFPLWFRRWMGGVRPVNAERDEETGLVCVQMTFSKHDLSPIATSRTIRFRWKAEQSAGLRILLWQRGRGIIHEQELPAAGAGHWHAARAAIPFGAAGSDARLSELKVLFTLDPPGNLQVEDLRS